MVTVWSQLPYYQRHVKTQERRGHERKSGQKNLSEKGGRKEERIKELKKELEELRILLMKAEILFKAKLNLEPMEEVKKDYPLLPGDPDLL